MITLVGAFSVIVKTDCETDGSFYSTTPSDTQASPPLNVGGCVYVWLWMVSIELTEMKEVTLQCRFAGNYNWPPLYSV